MNWMQYLQNPKGTAIVAFMQQVVHSQDYNDVINRMSTVLITDNDISLFTKMINDVYEAGYLKAIEDCKQQFKNMNVNITTKNQVQNQK